MQHSCMLIDDVYKKLIILDVNKGMLTDQIHPWLLKKLAHTLSPVVASLFNSTFKMGIFASDRST